jgi:hypothetical protein
MTRLLRLGSWAGNVDVALQLFLECREGQRDLRAKAVTEHGFLTNRPPVTERCDTKKLN